MKKLLLTLVGAIWSVQVVLATTCAGAIAIPAAPTFPYTQSLVCGASNDITSANSNPCGFANYLGGQESVYAWTPSVNYINASIAYNGVTWTGIFVYAGCPTAGGTCVGAIGNSTSSKTLNVANFTAGVTYYFVFDTWPTPNSPCAGTFTLNATIAPPANPATPSQFGGIPTCTTGTQLGFTNSTLSCSASAAASGQESLGITATVNNFSCATGTVTSATMNASIGANCPAWYYYSIVVNGVTVATNQCNQTGFDLTPFLPLTSVSIVSADNPADGPGDIVNMALTVNLNYQVPFSMPANVVYYWQTSPTGTSQAIPHLDPYYVFANGTYYVRAYNTATGAWSTGSSSVVVSNFPVASAPSAAIATVNPSCAPAGSSLTAAAAPSGYDYYWQGTVLGGSSTALPATAPYTYTASGTYYLAAYETASGCWSNTVGTTVTVNSIIPPAPIVAQSVYNVCSGVGSVPITAATPPSNTSVCSATATANGSDAAATTATVNSFPCITGIVTSASMNASIGGNCPSWYSYSIVVNGVTVATNQCNQTGFDLTPYLPISSVSIVSANNPADSPDNVTMNLTVNLNIAAPTYTLLWYDAAASGNVLGASSPLETVGSSVMPTTVNGAYEFYVGTNFDGCLSATNELVTVYVSDVNAPLTPVGASCNGGTNGSFILGTVQCGTQPFLYSIDGGAFGAIPITLAAGSYSVVIQDNVGLLSSPIPMVISQPAAPATLAVVQANYFTADISWTTLGNETSWNVEFGPVGFTPGTGAGTIQVSNSTSYTITGLTADTQYDVYVSAICGPNPEFSAPLLLSTDPGFFTYDNLCGPGFTDISGTGTALGLCDDCTTTITTANPVTVDGTSSTAITISNNGYISFGGVTLNVWNLDLDTESGNVYWEETTIAGDNYFIVEWFDRPRFSGVVGQAVTFEVMINQTTGEVYYLYDDVIFGGSQASNDYAATGLISAITSSGTTTVSSFSATYLQNNSCVHFYNALCPDPTNVITTINQEDIIIDWTAGAYGETQWTVIYGPAGFDPATSGTTVTTLTSDIFIAGLTQLTAYDIYIYSECTVDNLTSGGFLVAAVTLPWCADPTTIGGATEVDSLFSTWNFTPAALAPQGLSSFNLQYGPYGFDLYSGGTIEAATGLDYADTVANASFLAGGVYQVYVQAVCGTDTSNFAGPYNFIMPLTNDSVCGAEMLAVDGTVYTFNNVGATAQTGEGALITGSNPAGYNGTILPMMTWGSPAVEASNWYTFVAPTSGSMWFSGQDENFFASQIAIYETTDCGDFSTFTLVAASDQTDAAITTKVAPYFTICGLTPGSTYYVLHDAWSNGTPLTGQYSIRMTAIDLEAGSFVNTLDVCTGSSVVLFDGITGYQNNGVWTAELASVGTGITDSLFNSAGLGYQVFDFEYRITEGCAYDSIVSYVQIAPASSAGVDGTVTVCRNEPVDLLSALSGNIDLGGAWYDPSNQVLTSSFIYANNIPGQFNYDYITGNGVCPNDTSIALVNVDMNCNWLEIDELYFGSLSISPNPTNGMVYISNEGSKETFNYEITNLDGRLISSKLAAINGTSSTKVDLSGNVTGMYIIRVFNDNAEKVFRIILQ
jgi:hypothetical protein